ncbi:hypothetical protein M0638_10085 [Roseomonas sp. NAR14]|uniref:Uncharacterized protein n=1 Tax=Roseomonas acroporae TaxID=2937791 RepID=A0A9X1Y9C8_9PROT|nr:hypothetical protein [Roseomonas acroporae]MCK8784730.1 hypothetical protein [Roseomonas acroporae]
MAPGCGAEGIFVDVSADRECSVVLMEHGGQLASGLTPFCDYLQLEIESVRNGAGLELALQVLRPVAVVAEVGSDLRRISEVIETVARHDRSLPLLLVMVDQPDTRGTALAAGRQWQLATLSTVASNAAASRMMDFLADAGRVAGIWSD